MRKFTIVLAFILILSMSAPAVYASPNTPNPNVIIVNPVSGSTVYSDHLLVSVKLTAPTSINVTVTQETVDQNAVTGSAIIITDKFTSTTNLSFYTRNVENVRPGNYVITVDTLNAEGRVVFKNSSPVEIKAKEDNPVEGEDTGPNQSGAANFLRSLLRIIFN